MRHRGFEGDLETTGGTIAESERPPGGEQARDPAGGQSVSLKWTSGNSFLPEWCAGLYRFV
jgi:hypothetical protein